MPCRLVYLMILAFYLMILAFSLPDQVTLDYHPFMVGLEFQLSEQVVEMESNLLKMGVVRRRN